MTASNLRFYRRDVIVMFRLGQYKNRAACVGARLQRLFDALRHEYVLDSNIHRVVQAVHPLDGADSEIATDEARKTATRELLVRLAPRGVCGHFLRLRQAAHRAMSELIALIHARDVAGTRRALNLLRASHRQGHLERQILADYVKGRELRGDHRTSLDRYLRVCFVAVESWLQSEEASAAALRAPARDRQTVEAAVLGALSPNEQSDGQNMGGSAAWLDSAVAALLRDVRSAQAMEPGFCVLGDVSAAHPFLRCCVDQDLPAAPQGFGARPNWLDGTPYSQRMWFCGESDDLDWLAILQDGLSRLVLAPDVRALDVVASFESCKAWDALAAMREAPDFGDDPIVQRRLEGVVVRQREAAKLSESAAELGRAVAPFAKVTSASRMAEFEEIQLGLLENLDQLELAPAEEALKRLRVFAKEVTQEGRRLDAERDHRAAALRDWFTGADFVAVDIASLTELEDAVAREKDSNVARRCHVEALLGLVESDCPAPLRSPLRAWIEENDRPRSWPTPDDAEDIGLYVISLTGPLRLWISALRHVRPTDSTYKETMALLELLAKRIPGELNALLEGRPEAAPLLRAALDLGDDRLTTYLDKVRFLLPGTCAVPVVSAGPLVPRQDGGCALPIPAPEPPAGELRGYTTAIKRAAAEHGDCQATGDAVESAFVALAEERFEAASAHALAAWIWASKSVDARQYLQPMAAIYCFSRLRTEEATESAKASIAVAALLDNWAVLEKRSKLSPRRLVEWWLLGIGKQRGTEGEGLAEHISLLGTDAGMSFAQSVSLVLRASDAPTCAEVLWRAVEGQRKATTNARIRLLMYLFAERELSAVRRLGQEFAGPGGRYLSAFVALADRSRKAPTPALHTAIRRNLRKIHEALGQRGKPFRAFVEDTAKSLQFSAPQIRVRVAEELEETKEGGSYRALVTIEPDETDPPYSLTIAVESEAADFRWASPSEGLVIADEDPLLDTKEIEILIGPHRRGQAAGHLSLRVTGETTSGLLIDETKRFPVHPATGEPYELISPDELLTIYEGVDAKPVSGNAFVGRHEELDVLEKSLTRSQPGAVILYGARRLGKTSLLDELRKSRCVSQRVASTTLFLVVPVDLFECPSDGEEFLPRFFRHIHNKFLRDTKNKPARQWFADRGVSRSQLTKAARLGVEFDEASFYDRLREYMNRLLELTGDAVQQIILVFDEFDKLLEIYRKGYEERVEELISQLRRAAMEERDIGVLIAGSDLMRKVLQHYRSALVSGYRLHSEGLAARDR